MVYLDTRSNRIKEHVWVLFVFLEQTGLIRNENRGSIKCPLRMDRSTHVLSGGLKGLPSHSNRLERRWIPSGHRAERTLGTSGILKKVGKAGPGGCHHEEWAHSRRQVWEQQQNPRLSFLNLTPPRPCKKPVYSKGQELHSPCVSTRESCPFRKVRWLDSGMGIGVLARKAVFLSNGCRQVCPLGTGGGFRLICLPKSESPQAGMRGPGENPLPLLLTCHKIHPDLWLPVQIPKQGFVKKVRKDKRN